MTPERQEFKSQTLHSVSQQMELGIGLRGADLERFTEARARNALTLWEEISIRRADAGQAITVQDYRYFAHTLGKFSNNVFRLALSWSQSEDPKRKQLGGIILFSQMLEDAQYPQTPDEVIDDYLQRFTRDFKDIRIGIRNLEQGEGYLSQQIRRMEAMARGIIDTSPKEMKSVIEEVVSQKPTPKPQSNLTELKRFYRRYKTIAAAVLALLGVGFIVNELTDDGIGVINSDKSGLNIRVYNPNTTRLGVRLEWSNFGPINLMRPNVVDEKPLTYPQINRRRSIDISIDGIRYQDKTETIFRTRSE